MADKYQGVDLLDASARSGAAVTPSDSTDINTTKALYIGTAGNIKVILADDSSAVTLTNCAVGYHPLRVTRVYSTDTTASGIVALY